MADSQGTFFTNHLTPRPKAFGPELLCLAPLRGNNRDALRDQMEFMSKFSAIETDVITSEF
jgi:hypothetical protein